jgi:hypothetical protein
MFTQVSVEIRSGPVHSDVRACHNNKIVAAVSFVGLLGLEYLLLAECLKYHLIFYNN